MAEDALRNLKAALLVENDDIFTWYQTAQAYSALKNDAMASQSTAELWYRPAGDARRALVFVTRARGQTQGQPRLGTRPGHLSAPPAC